MNKEIIIPIIVGFAVGIVVMYGVVTARRSLNEQGPVSPQPESIELPTPTNTNSDASPSAQTNPSTTNFNVINPYPNALVTDDNLIVRGFTSKEDKIIIMTETTTLTTSPDTKGEFETEIKLNQGSNYLTFFSINPQGISQRIDQSVLYSPK